jgi:hypothetical protein
MNYATLGSSTALRIIEKLPLELTENGVAELHATSNGWCVVFVFDGPDGRYNRSYVTILPNEVPHLGPAMIALLQKYLILKPTLGPTSRAEETFGHVTMRVGGSFDGICLGSHHVRIRDREALDRFLGVLSEVPSRGETLVDGLVKAARLEASLGADPPLELPHC